MSRHSQPEHQPNRVRPRLNEDGFTLVELLIATSVVGILFASMTMAMLVQFKTTKSTEVRLTETRDVAFVQAYVPGDLASAVSVDLAPTAQPGGVALSGSNVATIVTNQRRAGKVVQQTVAYRFEKSAAEYSLVRYLIGAGAGGANQRTVVIQSLAPPPTGWTDGQSSAPAAEMVARSQAAGSAGADLRVTFSSGRKLQVGGTGFGGSEMTPITLREGGGVTVPPSPCGGVVTLILDVSGSISQAVWQQNVRDAALGLIDGLTGTPSSVNVMKFALRGEMVAPASFGTYSSVLNPADAVQLKASVSQMAFTPYATNWEDPLWMSFRDNAGTRHAEVPGLVVFVTDGQPNLTRNSIAVGKYSWDYGEDATEFALRAADYGRANGARIVGVGVGDITRVQANIDRLKRVVGSVSWTGTGASDPGNAETAQYFQPTGGQFSELGSVLRAIVAGQCGGALTIVKSIDSGVGVESAPTPWTYLTESGGITLDPEASSSITVDYSFPTGISQRTTRISEDPQAGYVLDRVECSTAGQPLGAGRVTRTADGTGIDLVVRSSEAVLCNFISKAA
jgi:prepilin-type N-terminal cleavage/methylation domain-containing protein